MGGGPGADDRVVSNGGGVAVDGGGIGASSSNNNGDFDNKAVNLGVEGHRRRTRRLLELVAADQQRRGMHLVLVG